MHVQYKSVPILDENYTERTRVLFSNRASSYWVRTTFAMNDVRDHTFDLPVYGHASHWTRVPVMGLYIFVQLGVVVLLVSFLHDILLSNYIVPWMDYLKYRTLPIGLVLAAVALGISYYFSCRRVKWELMEASAREVRGLKSTDRLKVVEAKDWGAFESSLR